MSTAPGQDATVDAIIARVRAVYGRWRRDTPVAQMRADWDALFWRDEIPASRQDLLANGVDVRWIAAHGASHDRVLIYFHGGGYTMGSATSHHDLIARISQAANCRVLGVNYRLVPETVFPAALDDAIAVYRWLLDQGLPAVQIALAGDSAGGGLAAACLLAIKQQGLPMPGAAVLLSSLLDLEANAASYITRADADPFHQRPMILALAKRYLGAAGDPRNPLASPIHGDLRGLPPLLLQTGDRETGRDETVDFAAKARAAGVEVDVQVYDGMIHVFQQFASELPQAREAIDDIGRFLRKHLPIKVGDSKQ